jgi:hypothetical protein
VSIEFVVDGDTRRGAQRFRKLEAELVDLTPAWEEAGKLFVDLVQGRFDEQAWTPLSPIYEARKVRDGFEPRIMVRTGHGLESLTRSLDVFRTEPHAITIGSTSGPMRWNAKGAYNPKTGRRLPRRRPVPVGVWRRRVRARLRRRLVNAAKAAAAAEV